MQVLEHRVLSMQRLYTDLILFLERLQFLLRALFLVALRIAAELVRAPADKQELRVRIVEVLRLVDRYPS